jgi:hypothetical protein
VEQIVGALRRQRGGRRAEAARCGADGQHVDGANLWKSRMCDDGVAALRSKAEIDAAIRDTADKVHMRGCAWRWTTVAVAHSRATPGPCVLTWSCALRRWWC